MTRRFLRAACLPVCLTVLVCSGFYARAAAQENDFRRALKVISDKFHQNFPYLQGEIVAVKGGEVFLSIGQKDQAVKGTQLTVLRKGAPFRHPVTGAVLGTLEDEIGVAEIVEVREKFSIARMTKMTSPKKLLPKVKDKVRLSSAKIRIAVLPFINKTPESLSTEIVTRELSRLFLSKGRFDVFDVDRLQVWLLESGLAADELLKPANAVKLKNQIRRDFVVENTIREVKGKKVLTSRLYSLNTRQEVFSSVAIADELPFELQAPKERALRRGGGGRPRGVPNQSFITEKSGIPTARGNAKSFIFSGVEAKGVSIADVNQDGKNEVIVITPTAVIVYQVRAGKMRELVRFDEGVGNDFRWLDIGDMNGNGIPEIYIANYRGDSLLSMVLELRGRKFIKLAKNQIIFYRLFRRRPINPKVKLPDKEAYLLLGQYSGFEKPLEGQIYRFRWSGVKKLVRAAPYAMPDGLDILGLGLWDMEGSGKPQVVEIGKDDFLRIYTRGGEIRHTSAARYGVPANVYRTDLLGTESLATDTNPKLHIRSRLLVVDTDGDQVNELLTIANEYEATRIAPGLGVSSGAIVSIIWDGTGLSEIWRSQKLQGGVVDFAYGDATNNGRNDLIVVAVTEGRYFSKKRTTVYLFPLSR